jgi:two-component system response regulator PilR (NtrC family)
MQEFLEIFFRSEGYDVSTADGVASGTLQLDADDFDVVITDIQMPDGNGLDLLQAAQEMAPESVVIVMTAFASTDTAIAAMKHGAYDYITKPFKVDEIRVVVEKALEKKRLSSENQRLRTELRSRSRDCAMVGNSPAIQRVFDFVHQVAETKANVLISGESGTGKEMVARAVHESGGRRERPFVAVNCGAIPENLLESELFGHVKGSFTGAIQNKPGLFEVAEGGTLFLDEIGEMALPLQVKLLRALQERVFRRVGGTSDIEFDARIVSASNRRLDREVAEGRFREDLYYRLNVIEVPLPSLRERRDDIPLLAAHFVEKYTRELDKDVQAISDDAMDRLMRYDYPGNVRELENIIERAVALCRSDGIGIDVLPPTVLQQGDSDAEDLLPESGVDLDTLMASYERRFLLEALDRSKGVKKRAAALLGITFRSFRYRLEKLGLDGESE